MDNELKMYCVWRTDIVIPYGKALVQAGHAFLEARDHADPARVLQYMTHSQPKIVLRAKSLAVLERAQRECQLIGLPHALIIDEGRTVFLGEPTVTCLGIGPVLRSELPKFIDRLQMLVMPDPTAMTELLMRIADPSDAIHHGTSARDLAQHVLLGRSLKPDEHGGQRLTADEILAKQG
jgi:peptidyl-tRNA hydrolase